MSDETTLEVERSAAGEGIVVLDLAGELVVTNRERLRERGEAEIAGGARSLVVGVGRLGHIDTSGLATLVQLASACAAAGGRLAVAGLREEFQEMRQHLFLDEALLFAASVEDAVAAVSR